MIINHPLIGILALLLLFVSCNGGEIELPDSEKKEPEPPTSSNLLYNGIELPTPWPPHRSYTSDLEQGMNPHYLQNKPEVIFISMGRQLFVDDFLIVDTDLERIYHYPDYHDANPILSPDKEWEKTGNAGAGFAAPFSDGVWYDETEKKFKMWYMGGGGNYTSINGGGVTCYAESLDGITWTKPILNIIEGTNIVDYGTQRDASSIWIDKQETNSTKRYKMFLVNRVEGEWIYTYKTSSDGKLWREGAYSNEVGDRSTVYKNPFRDTWVYSIRHNIRVNPNKLVRARDYYENADPVAGTRKAEALLSSFWFGPWKNELRHPDYPEVSPAIYNHDAIAYESIMLGFFNVWQGPENDICIRDNVIKRNQIMVGYSRDGYSWYREDSTPFLPVNTGETEWNQGNLQSVIGSPIIVGDKLYFYLSGRKLSGNQQITSTGLATLRRDGFASMKGTGTLSTGTLRFDGEYFFINANVMGSIRVELLDKQGNVIKGFSKDDCLPFTGDSVKKNIKWKSNPTLSTLKNKEIKIKFYLDEGEIYSFWISPSSEGQSLGYTGGGGLGYNHYGIDK